MPRPCSCCRHPSRRELDEALVDGTAYRNVAERYSVSLGALNRHRAHVTMSIVKAAERKDERREETLREKVDQLEADARRLAEKAESEGDLRAALLANRGLLDVIRFTHEMAPARDEEAGLRAAFERMTPVELDRYAREGVTPEWFPAVSTTGRGDAP